MVGEYKLKMVKLIKWLIFGEQCKHNYHLDYQYNCDYFTKRTYICSKCGKFKTIKY